MYQTHALKCCTHHRVAGLIVVSCLSYHQPEEGNLISYVMYRIHVCFTFVCVV